jgi:hypothetical protein
LDFAKEKLTTAEIIKLLLATDHEKMNTWHVAADCGELKILKEIWDLAEENLKTEEINNILLLVTDDKKSTVFLMVAEACNLEILQEIWEWSKKILTTGR